MSDDEAIDRALAALPHSDEPLSADDIAADEAGYADYLRGDSVAVGDGLSDEEEARLFALLGVGPQPTRETTTLDWTGDVGWSGERLHNLQLEWAAQHDTDTLLRFAAGKGWFPRITDDGGEWEADVLSDERFPAIHARGPDPRTALARAILKAAEDGG